jgi:hypothetical protein
MLPYFHNLNRLGERMSIEEQMDVINLKIKAIDAGIVATFKIRETICDPAEIALVDQSLDQMHLDKEILIGENASLGMQLLLQPATRFNGIGE